ncbi:UvrD-helicase domain-containing protein [Bifidobacterium sp. MA2]|uniref:DNA 3'-5' helicase n=1 Tax=Bifidobacterium santillanense TaxID=2809028 RepID=A0ABS5UPG2_9BIFI|nr:ATP-dependent DNA helicase [Bifidobacterium santillanense]MBT1172833.1 UvrD-helicase domain-containing protein [Bifidobacterium santillanense]
MTNAPVFTDSPEQAAVVGAPADADVLVVAGAGSGKTYTMTRRIIALIERGVAPEAILGLTFTRKAAGELLARVSAAVTDAREDAMFLKPSVLTYDAFFQSIVRQYGLLVGFDQNTQPLSEAGALQLAADVIDEHMDELRGVDLGAFSTLAGRVLALSGAIGSAMIGGDVADMDRAIAEVRAWDGAFAERVRDAIGGEDVPEEAPSLKPPRHLKKDTDETWAAKLRDFQRRQHEACLRNCADLVEVAATRDVLLDLVEAYTAAKRRRDMAEFGDFTIAAYQLVTRFPSIGERYRRRFSHVLLDEYQDTSTTQASLLATLFHGPGTAVNAVGDPFQSIYAWRGASPGAFRMFQRDFRMPADARPYALSVTRRNARLVLEAANDLTLPLREAPRRAGSSLMREVDVTPLGTLPGAPLGTLGVLGYDTLGQEIDAVVRFCRHCARRDELDAARGDGPTADPDPWNPGPKRRSVAVLFRSKKHMADYQRALEEAGLTTLVVGYSAMLERPEIRDVLALLHVAADHTDSASLMRLLATPRFGLDTAALTALASIAETLNMETRFRALAAAGIAPTDAPRERWASIVREHRNEVANAVFLPDVMLRGDLERLIDGDDRFAPDARRVVLRAGSVLRRVHDVVGRPLPDVVREAVRALDLDIDTVLAQAMHADPDGPADVAAVNPTLARIPMDAIIDLTDTYAAEIAAGSTPTLRGFMAWVDALGSIEDETATLRPDQRADVELMTVHQSKGLEWDSVAIVGLAAGAFPSGQGDRLSVTPDESHVGGMEGGVWHAPEYRETARTWLDDPTAVPAPIRADAGILPRFPHDAPADADPIASLDALDGVEAIDDEVYGTLRAVGDGVDEVDPDSWHLTQREEYGRRLHADERRLMYVALTRAKEDVLLTYSRRADPGRVAADDASSREAKPSNFWTEVHDALGHRPDVVGDPGALPEGVEPAATAPDGFFVGERAREYEDAVVRDALLDPVEDRDEDATLPWPASLSGTLEERLDTAAEAVRGARRDGETGPSAPDGPLMARARLLVADEDLMAGTLEGADLDAAVKAKAQRILAGSRRSVTSLQARAGQLGEHEERRYWRGIVRPIPSVASPAASAGTRFHAWAERFVDAAIPDGRDVAVTRETLLDDLRARRDGIERQERPDAVERDLVVWEGRLADSPWARRTPAWAERQLVVALPGLDGIIANGKLDAVFVGGLDPDDPSKRFTVVDWKTGRRPRDGRRTAEKLVQLDLYRLLLSAMEGVPLDSIDAALYYVSEPDEARRQLRAEAKTEQDIIAELSSGVPEQSDDD